jgi:hypothetical protein
MFTVRTCTFSNHRLSPNIPILYIGQNVSIKHNIMLGNYIILVGLHVSTLPESSSGPQDTDPYSE